MICMSNTHNIQVAKSMPIHAKGMILQVKKSQAISIFEGHLRHLQSAASLLIL